MKNHIALVSVLGALILAGCAGAAPQAGAVAPSNPVALTSAELANSELAPSPYDVPVNVFFTSSEEDDALLPSVRHPEPLPLEEASATPVTRTWGVEPPAEYGF